MGRVVRDSRYGGNQGGRKAASFKDGAFVRTVEIRPYNFLIVRDVEGSILYTETACPADFAIQTIDCETSSYTGALVLVLGGFTPDTDDSRVLVLATDYAIAPPVWYQG